MEWTINVKEKDQYVEVITKGQADKNSSLDMVKALAVPGTHNNIKKVLIDHSNLDSVSGKTHEVYERPNQFEIIGVNHGIKIAEVIRPEHHEFFYFLETVCRNRGYIFSIFNNKKSALEWLLK